MDPRLQIRRLLARATFGARPGELEPAEALGAEGWLAAQLAPAPDPSLAARLAAFPRLGAEPGDLAAAMGMERDLRRDSLSEDDRRELAQRSREIAADVVAARVVRAVHGARGLREVMIDFWSNHFSVHARKPLVAPLLPHYQREIERHALGRFEDLLFAVARSPAMLLYLDNWISTEPHPLARRIARRRGESRLPGGGRGGINENYARELLELHTLGVDGGYTQRDVQEVARVFTGWTLESRQQPVFRFRDLLHARGDKSVLGERIRDGGEAEGEDLLRRLARHPATARHLAFKLARRFVADDPPPGLVDRAAARFLETGGDTREVLRSILLSPEFADPTHRKLKTPLRFVASALRTTGGSTDGSRRALLAMGRLGEAPFFASTPAGHPEEARHWIDPGAMLERMAFAFALAGGFLPGTALGPALPVAPATEAGGAAPASRESLALALASPEFQWA